MRMERAGSIPCKAVCFHALLWSTYALLVADVGPSSKTALYAAGAGLGASKAKKVGKYPDGYTGYVHMAQDAVSSWFHLDRMRRLCIWSKSLNASQTGQGEVWQLIDSVGQGGYRPTAYVWTHSSVHRRITVAIPCCILLSYSRHAISTALGLLGWIH